jgi:hypothetical protein
MGSAIGLGLSLRQKDKGERILEKMYADQKAAQAKAEAMTPAESVQAEGALEAAAADRKRRRGVQSTFTARQEETVG